MMNMIVEALAATGSPRAFDTLDLKQAKALLVELAA
jgi:hypothetical protein